MKILHDNNNNYYLFLSDISNDVHFFTGRLVRVINDASAYRTPVGANVLIHLRVYTRVATWTN